MGLLVFCGSLQGDWNQLHQGAVCWLGSFWHNRTRRAQPRKGLLLLLAGAAVAGQGGCFASPAVIWADAGLSVAHVPGLRAQHPAQTQHQTHPQHQTHTQPLTGMEPFVPQLLADDDCCHTCRLAPIRLTSGCCTTDAMLRVEGCVLLSCAPQEGGRVHGACPDLCVVWQPHDAALC